jgi:hypothetical protein
VIDWIAAMRMDRMGVTLDRFGDAKSRLAGL